VNALCCRFTEDNFADNEITLGRNLGR